MRQKEESPEEIYLDSVRLLDRKVNLMRKNLVKLRESLDIKGVSFDNDGSVKSTRPTDKMAEAILRVVDYERELNEEEVRLTMLRLEVEKIIDSLDDPNEREVLKRRYLLFQSYDTIMSEMEYSDSRIYTFRRKALSKIIIPKVNSKKQ